MEPALPRTLEEIEEVKAQGTDKRTPATLTVGAGALLTGGLLVGDLPDLLDPPGLPGVVEMEGVTILGEVQSFARCANNLDTKRVIPSAPASLCCASCVTLRGTI